MEGIFRPSHYLIRVPDLAAAVHDYESAGFTVVWGSAPEKAHNALIHFESGGFLELFDPMASPLLAPIQRAAARVGKALGNPLLVRMHHWIHAEGLCDFALETTEALPMALDAARTRGVRPSRVMNASRTQADGTTTRWQLAAAHRPELPFLMGPYDPPPRIGPEQLTHENGLDRLAGLRIVDPDPHRYAEDLCRQLGGPESELAGNRATVHAQGFDFVIEEGPRHRLVSILTQDPVPSTDKLHGLLIEPA